MERKITLQQIAKRLEVRHLRKIWKTWELYAVSTHRDCRCGTYRMYAVLHEKDGTKRTVGYNTFGSPPHRGPCHGLWSRTSKEDYEVPPHTADDLERVQAAEVLRRMRDGLRLVPKHLIRDTVPPGGCHGTITIDKDRVG